MTRDKQVNNIQLSDAKGSAIAFYNTENFFDTHDNPTKNDDSFLPTFFRGWTHKRYERKVNNISKVIENLHDDYPILVGLAEIENKWILKDLVNTSFLRDANYSIIHYDSEDERGIDVCCIYRKEYLQILEQEPIKIHFDFDEDDTTRDILYVKALLQDDQIIHFFISHWPSRGKGQKETEPKRITVAKIIRKKIDKILQENPTAKILVMGDFNDYPYDISVTQYLRASDNKDAELYNMAAVLERNGKGSYNHRGDWGMLDQMIVSKGLRQTNNGYHIKDNKMYVFNPDWLLFKHRKFGYLPIKTYTGRKYIGGYSDHLPVYLILDS